MIERADILSLLKRESESLPYAAILRALGGRPANRELKRLLEGLVRDGEVVRSRGNRYTLAGASTTGTITGTLSLHRDGYGFVRVGDGSEDVFVPAKAIGSAMHGDTVTVKAERSRYQGQQRREGRITTIVTRAHASMVGRIQFTSRGALLIPEDQRVATPVIITAGSVQAAVDGQQVVVAITRWPVGGRPAEGRITEILGWPDDPDVEVMTVIHSHNLPFSFSDSQLREAELVPNQISRDDLRDRVDLRKRLTVTIDGETARDFDDAVSIAREGDHYRLWVSIADVSHYVRPGSELDREALVRGTSVYFPDRCIPMLPERLSNGICSLNPAVDRLTMTAEMLFDQTGTMIDQQFYPSVITSDARLTYTIVKELVVDGLDRSFHDKREVIPSLILMKELALLLKEQRQRRGSIDFDLPEPVIVLDLTGKTEAIIRSEQTLAHQIIEEFMLAANEAVAQHLTKKLPKSLYRVHEAPDQGKLAAFRDLIAPFGYTLPPEGVTITPQMLQRLIKEADGRPEERMVNYGLLRCMKQARYAAENFGHFGLASASYTHFTSPIRRYPDLIIHRLLKLSLSGSADSRDKRSQRDLTGLLEQLSSIAEQTSQRERAAMEAERDIVELKKLQYMQDKVGESFEGYIAGVAPFGLFVELKDIFVEGLVHLSTLSDDRYEHDERQHALIGRRSGKQYRLGDQVQVMVISVDPRGRKLEFELHQEKSIRPVAPAVVDYAPTSYPRVPIAGKRPRRR